MNGKRIQTTHRAILILSVVFCVCVTSSGVMASEQEQKSGIVYMISLLPTPYRMEEQNHYHSLLKQYRDFKKTSISDAKLKIGFTHEKLPVLKNQYELDKIAGNGDDLSKALNLLFWLCDHTYHKGDYDNHIPMNSLDLLEYSFDKGRANGVNCLNLSVILTECLLSIGLPAHTVGLMPFSHEDMDNHVVVHVHIASLGKWMMLDPSWCSYFSDEEGNILDIFEIRNRFADDEEVHLNEEFSYCGVKLISFPEMVRHYKQYMAKDLFYFTVTEISTFGRDANGGKFFVCPENFNHVEALIKKLEYNLNMAGTLEGLDESFKSKAIESLTKQLERLNNLIDSNDGTLEETLPCLSPEDFLAAP